MDNSLTVPVLLHKNEIKNENVMEMEQYLETLVLKCTEYPTGRKREIKIYGDGVAEHNGYRTKIPPYVAEDLINKFLDLDSPPEKWTYGFPSTHSYDDISLELRGKDEDPIKYNFINLLSGTGHMKLAKAVKKLFQ